MKSCLKRKPNSVNVNWLFFFHFFHNSEFPSHSGKMDRNTFGVFLDLKQEWALIISSSSKMKALRAVYAMIPILVLNQVFSWCFDELLISSLNVSLCKWKKCYSFGLNEFFYAFNMWSCMFCMLVLDIDGCNVCWILNFYKQKLSSHSISKHAKSLNCTSENLHIGGLIICVVWKPCFSFLSDWGRPSTCSPTGWAQIRMRGIERERVVWTIWYVIITSNTLPALGRHLHCSLSTPASDHLLLPTALPPPPAPLSSLLSPDAVQLSPSIWTVHCSLPEDTTRLAHQALSHSMHLQNHLHYLLSRKSR